MDSYENDNDYKVEVDVHKRSDSFEIEKPLFSDNETDGLKKDGLTPTTPSKADYDSHYLTLSQVGFLEGVHSSSASP